MCTVTYVPTSDGFFLTSSRDENIKRKAVPLRTYRINQQELIFPKDVQSGGTWVASSKSQNRVACLLNGAYKNHLKKRYNKSRGLVLLDNFNYDSIMAFCEQVVLLDIEPFTLLLLDWKDEQFVELIWDGSEKNIKNIATNKPQIWLSATLYDSDTKRERRQIFQQWIEEKAKIEKEGMVGFHQYIRDENNKKNKMLQGGPELQTVSISSISQRQKQAVFHYIDILLDNQVKLKI